MKFDSLKKMMLMPLMAAFLFCVSAPVVMAFDDPPQEEEEKERPSFRFDDNTLLNFFDANREISALQRETQERINALLAAHNMTAERFGQIGRAAQIGALTGGTFSNEEIETFNSVAPQVTDIQRDQQASMQALLNEKGLSTNQYQEIMNNFRQDQELQAYVSELARERAIEQVREERRRQRELEEAEGEEASNEESGTPR